MAIFMDLLSINVIHMIGNYFKAYMYEFNITCTSNYRIISNLSRATQVLKLSPHALISINSSYEGIRNGLNCYMRVPTDFIAGTSADGDKALLPE